MITAVIVGLLIALIPTPSPGWRFGWAAVAFVIVFLFLSNLVPLQKRSPAVCFEPGIGWKMLIAVPKPFC